VTQRRALGREEGLAEGEAIGASDNAQEMLVNVVHIRFPSLEGLARRKVELTQQAENLNKITNAIVATVHEALARAILSSPLAA